ncbi:hypothetical protein, partial [Ralstonia pseudosolanacearum]|uniref:hypothetical protein n=1 Tax=Ralstonia pseudosolanacearum TaxID=1310165 RepID=UPI0020051C50
MIAENLNVKIIHICLKFLINVSFLINKNIFMGVDSRMRRSSFCGAIQIHEIIDSVTRIRVAYVDASRIASCLACWSAGKGSTLMSGPLMQAVWPAGPYG